MIAEAPKLHKVKALAMSVGLWPKGFGVKPGFKFMLYYILTI